jgi:saccharopine dehydrogenase-like NADP-dependent oxidoreductase
MKKKVLILGAGRVSAPCVDYLVRKGDCDIVLYDIAEENVSAAAKTFPQIKALRCDAGESPAKFVDEHGPDLVIALLPPQLIPGAARICLEKRANLVHPAYLDDETLALSEKVKSSGLIFLAEIGLDPGIDHMSAACSIEEIHARGGKVESFRSLCGALPAPEANSNPWGYKLSWSPSSLIGASKRSAKIIDDGKIVSWPDGETYEHAFLLDIPGFSFEVYANADSTVYREGYGIPEVKSLYRGTLRYPGWCETICYMNMMKFFDTDEQETKGLSFARFSARQAGASDDPKRAFCERLGLKPWSAFILRMEWLGFFDERPIPFDRGSARDVVSLLFSEKLVFAPEERDLVVLYDEIESAFPDGKKELHRSVLVDYGVPGKWTSIAKTTGVPLAIAARFIMDGTIKTPGILKPVLKEIYEPVLAELAAEGIVLEQTVKSVPEIPL